jgi:hypothetical protein
LVEDIAQWQENVKAGYKQAGGILDQLVTPMRHMTYVRLHVFLLTYNTARMLPILHSAAIFLQRESIQQKDPLYNTLSFIQCMEADRDMVTILM